MRICVRTLLFACASCACLAAHAQEAAPSEVTAAFQATYVWQRKPSFASAYEGPRSLTASRETGYSFSATGYFSWRPSPTVELHFDGEAVQGTPLSHSTGLGGLTNAEAQKSAGPGLMVYRARVFARRTWEMGNARVVVTAGNFAVTDVFDRSNWAGDPRTQFLNLAFVTHGAFDYAADARGYTWGAALEGFTGDWELRAGHFLLPREPNGPSLDWQALTHFGEAMEVVHVHRIGGRKGNVRLLAFRDRAVMARFDDALYAAGGGVPALDAVRRGVRTKRGWGVAFEQAVAQDAGVFARAARSDGKEEVYAFAEVDRSMSAGVLTHGARWNRSHDSFGIALARNGLSPSHRAYLAAGGLGYFIGDGRLNYAPEAIAEVFYSAEVGKHATVTFDWQRLRHPGYNADRGPVHVASVRLHAEF